MIATGLVCLAQQADLDSIRVILGKGPLPQQYKDEAVLALIQRDYSERSTSEILEDKQVCAEAIIEILNSGSILFQFCHDIFIQACQSEGWEQVVTHLLSLGTLPPKVVARGLVEAVANHDIDKASLFDSSPVDPRLIDQAVQTTLEEKIYTYCIRSYR